MSDIPPASQGQYDPEECSHDEAWLIVEGTSMNITTFTRCRRCGMGLRLTDGHRLKVNKSERIIDFEYECIDCGMVVSFPSKAQGTECGD